MDGRSNSRQAKALWNSAAGTEDHEALRAYFKARGVDPASLPGGRVPSTLRYGERIRYFRDDEEAGRAVEEDPGPAVLGVAVDAGGTIRAVQRIYLDVGGQPAKRKCAEAKKALGPIGGAAVRLSEPKPSGSDLILCEGIETGIALLATFPNAAVWACISAQGIRGVKLPHHLVQRDHIRRVFIAGDCDRQSITLPGTGGIKVGPGEKAALDGAEALIADWPGLEVYTCIPTAETAPGDVDDNGAPAGSAKSVDWLDVYVKHGAARVALGVSAELGHEFIGRASADERRVMPDDDLARSHLYLRDEWTPKNGSLAHSGYHLVSHQGVPYRFDGTGFQLLGPQEALRCEIRRWATPFQALKRNKLVPFNPALKTVNAIVEGVKDETLALHPDDRFWLRPRFDNHGDPLPRPKPWQVVVEPEHLGELPQPDDVLAVRNGLLDTRAWMRGEVRCLPHSPLFFNQTVLDVDLPLEEMRRAVKEDVFHELVGGLCPEFLHFLEESFEAEKDPEGASQNIHELQKLAGYWLTPRIEYQEGNIAVLTGPGGAGKSTFRELICALLGVRNWVSTRIDKLADNPHLSSWIGKLLAIMPDASLPQRADGRQCVEILKTISGGDPISMRDVYEKERPVVRLRTRFLIVCNQMPELHDTTNALARRMIVIEFRKSVEKPDHGLLDRLKQPKSLLGIFLWALQGLRELEQDGRFHQPQSSATALEAFKDQSSLVDGEFVDDWLDISDPNAWSATTDLFEAWQRYCGARGVKHTGTPQQLMTRLLSVLQRRGWRGMRKQRSQQDAGDGRVRRHGYTGIKVGLAFHAAAVDDSSNAPWPRRQSSLPGPTSGEESGS